MTDLDFHRMRLKNFSLKTLAHGRANTPPLQTAGWVANLARQRLDAAAEGALIAHGEAMGLQIAIRDLFAGAHVNPSENRPALHWALRSPVPPAGLANTVKDSLGAGDTFADGVRSGAVTAPGGKPFKNIVHIGIGGSDFGPRLLADAFELEARRDLTLRFCANVDPTDLTLALDGLDPSETLVIGVSKSFGTEETLYNLTRAKAWLQTTLGAATAGHLALITSQADRARSWLDGAEPHLFDMPESVGGRFSIWSNASLACRIVLGGEIIDRFRAGAAAMDDHVRTAPLAENMAAHLALVDYWNRAYLGATMRVVLAYARRLRLLPTYLQQLEMESNGKTIQPNGEPAPKPTAPALWGGEGSIGQHSYHQWLHQGSVAVPTEFILARDPTGDGEGWQALTAHALAQAEVLANGRTLEEIEAEEPSLDPVTARQKVHTGGRASSFLYCNTFDAFTLGSLIALYEHRTYLAGKLWQINSFDQWGVERGKTMAGRIKQTLAAPGKTADPVTDMLSRDLR